MLEYCAQVPPSDCWLRLVIVIIIFQYEFSSSTPGRQTIYIFPKRDMGLSISDITKLGSTFIGAFYDIYFTWASPLSLISYVSHDQDTAWSGRSVERKNKFTTNIEPPTPNPHPILSKYTTMGKAGTVNPRIRTLNERRGSERFEKNARLQE